MKKEIWVHKFSCKNGAFHSDMCCPTCANQYKKDINTDDDFRFSHAKEIKKSREEYYVLTAKEAGFTKKQAIFLYEN